VKSEPGNSEEEGAGISDGTFDRMLEPFVDSLDARRRSNKQSGVSNITWHHDGSWLLNYYEVGRRKQDRKTRRSVRFSLAAYARKGDDEEAADRRALKAAKAKRAELVREGVIITKKPSDTSSVPGVTWYEKVQRWVVCVSQHGKTIKTSNLSFKPENGSASAKQEARKQAEARARELEEKHCIVRVVADVTKLYPTLPMYKSPDPGVHWDRRNGCWKTCSGSRAGGKGVQKTFRPEGSNPEDIERSRQLAVAWRRGKQNAG